ncbi:MAG: hypothetical protein PHP23_11970 [Desulfobacterales bacterium]|nr:hypothetical protein [Desulfobacterales bacterium]MDD4073190.1 hypothetical protein [Desulfobacterales bacterium]
MNETLTILEWGDRMLRFGDGGDKKMAQWYTPGLIFFDSFQPQAFFVQLYFYILNSW